MNKEKYISDFEEAIRKKVMGNTTQQNVLGMPQDYWIITYP